MCVAVDRQEYAAQPPSAGSAAIISERDRYMHWSKRRRAEINLPAGWISIRPRVECLHKDRETSIMIMIMIMMIMKGCTRTNRVFIKDSFFRQGSRLGGSK